MTDSADRMHHDPDKIILFNELYDNFIDRQAWLQERFSRMETSTFFEFREYVTQKFCDEMDGGNIMDMMEKKGLLLAITSKAFEAAHFHRSIDDNIREKLIEECNLFFQMIKYLYPDDIAEKVQAAWDAQADYSGRFGWPGVVFEVLRGGEPVFVDG